MRSVKKYGYTAVIILLLLCICGIHTFAQSSETEETKSVEELSESIYDAINEDAAEILCDLDLSEFSMDGVLALSPRTVIDALLSVFTDGFAAPLRATVLLCTVAVLLSLSSALFLGESKIQTAFDMCTVFIVTCILAKPLTDLLETAFSAVSLCGDFMLTYIPGFAGIIAMSGKPLTSAAYSSVMVGVANLYAQGGIQFFLPFILVYLSLSVFSSLQEKYALQPIVRCLQKIIYTGFGLSATLFSGLLTVKGALAAGGDTVTVKGVKMLVGSSVPIVGGALSEGVTSVLASAALIKSTVGIFGIFVIVCTALPAVIELLLWHIALSFSGAVSESLGQTRIKNLLQSIAGVLSVTNVFVIFTAYVFIISTGVILQFRGT